MTLTTEIIVGLATNLVVGLVLGLLFYRLSSRKSTRDIEQIQQTWGLNSLWVFVGFLGIALLVSCKCKSA